MNSEQMIVNLTAGFQIASNNRGQVLTRSRLEDRILTELVGGATVDQRRASVGKLTHWLG